MILVLFYSGLKTLICVLNRFISRRVAHILLLSQESEWHYCSSSMNAADVGTRPGLIRKVEARDLWFKGPSFLQENVEFNFTDDKARNVTVRKIDCSPEVDGLDKLIERAPSLYVLQKRVAYIMAFCEYFRCKAKRCAFVKPTLNADYLSMALNLIARYVQTKAYGHAQARSQDLEKGGAILKE